MNYALQSEFGGSRAATEFVGPGTLRLIPNESAPESALTEPHTWRSANRAIQQLWNDFMLLAGEGLIPPSARAISAARQLTSILERAAAPAPTRVIADGDGGLVLERRSGELRQSFEIVDSGCVELVVANSGRVVQRIRVM